MKILIALLAILIPISLYSQTVPVSKRFLGEEYRLFLPKIELSTNKTDQIFTVNLVESEGVYVIESNAMKFVCDLKTSTAEVYFDNQYDDIYLIKFWDCYSFFVIEIPLAKTTYHFFRIYSLDKAW